MLHPIDSLMIEPFLFRPLSATVTIVNDPLGWELYYVNGEWNRHFAYEIICENKYCGRLRSEKYAFRGFYGNFYGNF